MHKISALQMYLVLALALLLHLTLLDRIIVFGAKPDLLLIVVIFFGLFLGKGKGFEAGLAAGLSKDLFALDFLGINAFIMAVSGLLAGALGERFSRESKKTRSLIALFLTAFSMTLHFIIVSVFAKRMGINFGEYLAVSIIPTCIYTVIISLPIFAWLINIFGMRGREDYL